MKNVCWILLHKVSAVEMFMYFCRKEIKKAYPHFMANIQGMNPKMSLVETRICLLAKIGMTSTQMARVLGYSKSGVTSARDRLYKKMFNEKVTEEGFAAFIKYV